jgi:ATP-dependent DNA helicase RecQ
MASKSSTQPSRRRRRSRYRPHRRALRHEHLIAILRGEETDKTRQFSHDRLPTFGVGKDHSRNEWRSIFRQLYGAGVMTLDVSGYGRWTVTDLGRQVLKAPRRCNCGARACGLRWRRPRPGAARLPPRQRY